MKGNMSAREASYKWEVSESRVHKLRQQGHIPSLERFGRSLVISADAEKPTDSRLQKAAKKTDRRIRILYRTNCFQ